MRTRTLMGAERRRDHLCHKALLRVDVGSGPIRQAVLTPAHMKNAVMPDRLIRGDGRTVYADKVNESKVQQARLRAQKIIGRIWHWSHTCQRDLPYWRQRHNALIAKVQVQVEQVFGTLKRS